MAHIVLARAWNNGKFLPNGGGYGIWLTNYFKDEYLEVNWVSITLELEGCRGRELRSGIIGKWLIANGKGQWGPGQEPEIFLKPLGGRRFAASLQPIGGVSDSVDAMLSAAHTLEQD